MIHRCAECGKEFDVLYPDLWRYRRWNRYMCSWKCLRAFDRKEGSGDMYTKLKKDGTPAKKAGPKPKTEPEVELVYDESIKEEYERDLKAREERGRRIAEGLDKADQMRKQLIDGIQPLPVAAVYSRTIDGARFKKMDGGMMLTTADYCIRLTAYEWFKLTEEILVAIRQLDATNPDMEV